jgi:multicomponent Na+:H+ antiporter subunit A
MFAVLWVVFIPFLFALVTPFIQKFAGDRIGLWGILSAVLSFGGVLYLAGYALGGEPLYVVYEWAPSLGLTVGFYVDGLSWLFALLISGIGVLINVYAYWYLHKPDPFGRFFAYLLFFMGSMLGLVLSSNLILLMIFWELTTISSFLLIGYWHHTERARYGAVKSILVTTIGGLAMLGGIVLLTVIAGTAEIPELIAKAGMIQEHALFVPILLLLLLGAFSKSAQSPFHIWLPDAMEAPTPVSAFLHSSTMVKAGVFLIARLHPVFSGREEWILMVASVGTITMVLAAYWALRKTDLKAILAYSTVSQLGLMIMALGFSDVLGAQAAAFHIMNHAAFKAALFLVVGIIDHETGTRDIRLLRGLRLTMPRTAVIAFIGAFASAGIPLFNGFVSKELIFGAAYDRIEIAAWMSVFPVIAVIGSALTFAYSMKIFFGVFYGKESQKLPKHPHDPPFGMLFSPGLLAAITVAVGIFPFIASGIINAATEAITQIPADFYLTLWHGFSPALFMSLVTVGIGLAIYSRKALLRTLHSKPPFGLTMNAVYDWWYPNIMVGAEKLIGVFQSKKLRFYFMYILGMAVVLSGWVLLRGGELRFIPHDLWRAETYEYIGAAAFILAAIGVVVFRSRLAKVIALGVTGYLLCAVFILLRAPDLALTQLLVDSVTVILFVLVIYFLPRIKPETERLSVKVRDLLVSVIAGGFVTVFVLAAYAHRYSQSVADYFLENSYTLGGGTNVVNVILVDFRAFDTLGEITVLAIAGLGVFALVRLGIRRTRKEDAS